MPGIVLYDGECGLCHRGVRFIAHHDRAARYRFASLQGNTGQRLLREHGLPPDALDTMVLIDEDGAFVRSAAAVRIARGLDRPWRALALLRILPRPLRDAMYDVVARNRHRLSGDTCDLPTPEMRARMIET